MGDKTSLITLQMFVCDIEDNIDKKIKKFQTKFYHLTKDFKIRKGQPDWMVARSKSLSVIRRNITDDRAAALYPADPGSNPVDSLSC